MSINEAKMQPWQVFHAARKYLGVDEAARIFNREKRSAYSWAQDPAYTECRCKSPLELLHTLFERMDTVGIGYVARAAIRYLETAIDAEVDMDEIVATRPTLAEEILADYSSVAALQDAINRGCTVEEARGLALLAKAEIDRTVAKLAEG